MSDRNMKHIILISAICLQFCWSYGAVRDRRGVGAYAYQDTSGRRYGGTYGLRDEDIIHGQTGPFPLPFGPLPYSQHGQNFDAFIPDYFSNLENVLQETFKASLQNQRLAYNAARKAFDLTSNHAGFIPNFYRFPVFSGFGNFPRFPTPGFDRFSGFDMSNLGDNSAFASASLIPGQSHQIAAINPANPANPNVNEVTHFSESSGPGNKFYSVSSSSFASSSNRNGQLQNMREAETVVNNNGNIVRYKVKS